MNNSISTHGVINRREFLRTAGAVSTLFIVTPAASNSQANTSLSITRLISEEIEESVKINFGSGFQVLSFRQNPDGGFRAQIEHLENEYSVISADLSQWRIIDSTEI